MRTEYHSAHLNQMKGACTDAVLWTQLFQTLCFQTLIQRMTCTEVQAHSQQLDFYADATSPIPLLDVEAKTKEEDEH